MDKPVLPKVEHLRGKISDEKLEDIKDILDTNQNVFFEAQGRRGVLQFFRSRNRARGFSDVTQGGGRRMSPHKLDACRKEIEISLEYDTIEPFKSPWACGVVLAKKNSVTLVVSPIHRIVESLSKLGIAKFFTTLDLGSAFLPVRLKKDSEKTRYACKLGLFQWKRMPFGLCNATNSFQRLMSQALTGLTKNGRNLILCNVEDVVIATSNLANHIERLDEEFACMKKAGLKSKASKCEILNTQ